MSLYMPGVVYENLVKMYGYRNIKLTEPILTSSELIKKLNHSESVLLKGERTEDDPRGKTELYTFLLSPGSKYSNKTVEFRKLLKQVPENSNKTIEIMFVSSTELTTFIVKQIETHKKSYDNIQIEHHLYDKFEIEIPKHVSVPEHIIMTEEETERVCREQSTMKENFPKISQNDTMAVWLGIHPGMLIKINRVSETACMSVAYRYCVKG